MFIAGMAELVDAPDSKSGGYNGRVGSNPTSGKEGKRMDSFKFQSPRLLLFKVLAYILNLLRTLVV